MNLDEITTAVMRYRTSHVTVTGGEPLAQKGCRQLLSHLSDQSLHVSLETSGALDVSSIDPRIVKVMDIKTPGSKESDRNLWQNIAYLSPRDQVKFVVCDHDDYEWCKQIITDHALSDKCEVLLSPGHEDLPAKDLAEWILADQLNVRFQTQLHKQLWGNEPGR